MKEDIDRSLDAGLDAAGLGQGLAAQDRQLLYSELKSAARRQRLAIGSPGGLQTTALVHETWLRLRDNSAFRDRSHFLASAAVAMRYVLIDHIRAVTSEKRTRPVAEAWDNDSLLAQIKPSRHLEILAIHDALQDLADIKPRCVRVIECRYFAGYTDSETSLALEINERTVRRDWEFARAWLRVRLQGPEQESIW
ncbi:MAG: ECF-type sigma factor [Rhodanobacteraceae bacterium]